jgi:hypothetical protein
MQDTLERVLANPPKVVGGEAEEFAARLGLLPSAFRLASLWPYNSSTVRAAVSDLANRCRSRASESKVAENWLVAAEVLETSFSDNADSEKLRESGDVFYSKQKFAFFLICHIGLIPHSQPRDALKAQAEVVPWLEEYLKSHGIYRRVIVPSIYSYWEARIELSPFHFRQPASTLEQIRIAATLPPESGAKRVLRLTASSLGVVFGGELLKWSERG